MNITRNAVYSFVHDAVTGINPSVYVTSVYEPVNANLPAVIVREIGNQYNRGNMTFAGEQGVRTSTFEADVVSGKTNGSMTEAHSILGIVRNAFFQLHYNEINSVIVEDGSTGRFRLRASYRRVIGDADALPTSN